MTALLDLSTFLKVILYPLPAVADVNKLKVTAAEVAFPASVLPLSPKTIE